jgi:hypothetical protein
MGDDNKGKCAEICCADGTKRMVCNVDGKLNVKDTGKC